MVFWCSLLTFNCFWFTGDHTG